MIHSIKDFSDSQIEELRQCPGVIITLDKREAEVPMMAEGLFLSISKNVLSVPTTETESKVCNATSETKVVIVTKEPIYTYEETQRLTGVSAEGLEAINKVKSVSSGSTVIEVRTNKRAECNYKSEKLCAKCGKPGQRFCFGESKSGKNVWAQFCLECYPHHF